MGRRHRSGYYKQQSDYAAAREAAPPKTPDANAKVRTRKMANMIYFPIYEAKGVALKLEYSESAFELFKTLTGLGDAQLEEALKWGAPDKHKDAPAGPRGFKPFQVHAANLLVQGERKIADKSKRPYVSYSPKTSNQFTGVVPITDSSQNPRAILANFAALGAVVQTKLGTSGTAKIPLRLTDESIPDTFEAEAGAPTPPAADPAPSTVP
jgi:hypothetical protein